jgi:hypothetical protein
VVVRAVGAKTHTASLLLRVGTGPVTGDDFTLTLPSATTLLQGASTSLTLSTAVASGRAQAITLAASGLPAGLTATFSPNPVTAGSTSTLKLTAAATAAPVTAADFVVQGNAASGSHAAHGAVTVLSSAPRVSIRLPLFGAVLSGTVPIIVDASAVAGASIARVDFLVDGALLASAASAPYTVDWDTGKGAAGAHVLTATAVDSAGRSATSTGEDVTVGTALASPGGCASPGGAPLLALLGLLAGARRRAVRRSRFVRE